MNILEIATNVSTPLMGAGFLAGAFFLILRQILKKDLFPTLTRQLSADIITLIIERLFILALVALVLGFAGFVVTVFTGADLALDPGEVAELQLYLDRCDDGVAEACNSAAVRIGDGKGAPVDFKRSAALYKKACELGSGRGCRNYARRLELGKGVPVNVEQAKVYYEKACELGYEKACNELKEL